MKFKYLRALQSNKNESSTEYYKNIVICDDICELLIDSELAT